jgi:hypothetical protein
MAAVAQSGQVSARDERFFFTMAIVIAAVVAGGFSLQLAMGRSSFASPLPVHLHALTFFGWTTLFVLQSGLAASGNVALHRRLGWLSAVWIPAMIVMGTYVTVAMVRAGRVPFFFTPGYFLIMDPLTVLAFAGLAVAAVANRRRTEWHRRLMLCAMAVLTAPAWGRILPMPVMIPFAGLGAGAAGFIFPLAGVVADSRRRGQVHPAWIWGLGAMALSLALVEIIGHSAIAAAICAQVTAGSPGAAIPALAYPPPPPL